MSFKIGDAVLVIDENLSGTVTAINGDTISVESTDGFILIFDSKELLKIDSKKSLKSDLFTNQSVRSVILEKEQAPRRKSIKVAPKERNQPTMEVDLHIHHLTTNEHRMSNYEMLNLQLDTAKRQLEFAIKNRVQKIVFIHGVGEGVLKMELESLFRRYENLKYYDADYQKYGVGATEVCFYQNTKS